MDASYWDIVFFIVFTFMNLLQTFMLTLFIRKVKMSKEYFNNERVESVNNHYSVANVESKVEDDEETYAEIGVKQDNGVTEDLYETPIEHSEYYHELNPEVETATDSVYHVISQE
ncbi:uncharacterized protein [Chironomus tepperi]|uniref:uncharacterized protein n=1 Tax=Chironomus tepperi TaxID=113505 RepID=UPI00391F41C3